VRATEFLEVAEALRFIERPAARRSAVSRAYYAVFHVATHTQRRLGARRSSSHDVVGLRFLASPEGAVRAIGDAFLGLKARRVESDYRLRSPSVVEDGDTVGAIVDDARQLCVVLERLPAGPLARPAAVGIRAFDALGGRG
jgi:hypothetical protein